MNESNVPRSARKANDQWWYVQSLITRLDATPTEKYALTLVHRHTNRKTGWAWASQEKLAGEMGVDVRTVKRIFAKWGKQRRVIRVLRIRKAKRPTEQNNHYCLDIEALKAWQHRTPMSPDKPSEHGTSMSSDSPEQGTPVSPNRGHFAHETGDTHVPEGFDESGGRDESGNEKARALHSARKSGSPNNGSHAQPDKPAAPLSEVEQALSEKLELFLRAELQKRDPVPIEFITRFVKQNATDSLDENAVSRIVETVRLRMRLQTMPCPQE